ncbi:MAG TPA: Gfo/Idh/MocA family oxidoreductase, partial [Anaerovoracaceae bacterium]|nr:Gfo/Idh/MocA family oxidoreductase [Anaerovoracaceae bacterium]
MARAVSFGLSVAEQFGIRGCKDPIAMINDPEIDTIINTTVDVYHEQFVLAAIAAGKYIFCEKPLAPKS